MFGWHESLRSRGGACVLALERLSGMSLSTKDRETAKAVVAALLRGTDEQRSDFTESIKYVFGIMGRKYGARVVELMTRRGHRSWTGLAAHVAAKLKGELVRPPCAICLGPPHTKRIPSGAQTRVSLPPRRLVAVACSQAVDCALGEQKEPTRRRREVPPEQGGVTRATSYVPAIAGCLERQGSIPHAGSGAPFSTADPPAAAVMAVAATVKTTTMPLRWLMETKTGAAWPMTVCSETTRVAALLLEQRQQAAAAAAVVTAVATDRLSEQRQQV